jgi:hypothetical protein
MWIWCPMFQIVQNVGFQAYSDTTVEVWTPICLLYVGSISIMPAFIFMLKCWAEEINYTLPRGYAPNLTLPGNSGNHRRIRKLTHNTCSNGMLIEASQLVSISHRNFATGATRLGRNCWEHSRIAEIMTERELRGSSFQTEMLKRHSS